MALFFYRRMKIVLPLILWFYGKSAVESQVLQAANVELPVPVPVPVPLPEPEEDYDDYSEDDYSDEGSSPNRNPIQIHIRKKRESPKEMKTSSYLDYYSYYDSSKHEPDSSNWSPDSDPQKGENRCEEKPESSQNQRIKRQAQPDVQPEFYSYYSDEYDDDSSEPLSIHPDELAGKIVKTESCLGLNNHRIRRFESDDRSIESGDMAKNLFYRNFGVGKRKKRQIEPCSDSEYDDDDESEYDRGPDNEYDSSKNYYSEEYSEVRPDEFIAYENALRNVGFIPQYEYKE